MTATRCRACRLRYPPNSGERRFRATLARHLRRQAPRDGGHLPQHGFGRFMGECRRSALSRTIFCFGISHRRRLSRLRHDTLELIACTCLNSSSNIRSSVFSKGQLVLLGSWPRWLLVLAILAAAGGFGAFLVLGRQHFTKAFKGYRSVVLWALDWALLALLLLLLWQPAISVTALKQNQNIIAVVIDDSRSMALKDVGGHARARSGKLALKAVC